MKELNHLFENNRRWAQECLKGDGDYFQRLSHQQRPKYLWIGCSDSRIPANQVIGLQPGEVFVHRNVANLVVNTDINCLSVIQYAVEFLGIEHIIICGHYGCGGVKAAMEPQELGLVDHWLRNIRDIAATHHREIESLGDPEKQYNRLVELNVCQQVRHVSRISFVQNAWARGQSLSIHGWVYKLEDGLLRDLNCLINRQDMLEPPYRMKR